MLCNNGVLLCFLPEADAATTVAAAEAVKEAANRILEVVAEAPKANTSTFSKVT